MPAYDTVVLKSSKLNEYQKNKLLSFCDKITRMNIETGELKSEFTCGQLYGSYDYRIRLYVSNLEWVKVEGIKQPVQIAVDWYCKLECSLHKLMCNHNVFGGPQDIKKSINYLIKYVGECANVELPNYLTWYPERIDVAKIFVFKNPEIVVKLIENLKKGVYCRRKLVPYENGGVCASGSTSTVKFYPKGNEFNEHDLKRFNKYILRESDLVAGKENRDLIWNKLTKLKLKVNQIAERAKRTLRFETEIKLRSLKKLCNCDAPTVSQLVDTQLFAFMEKELKNCIKEREDMDIVRRSDLVEERLDSLYGSSLSKVLFGTWALLCDKGEIYVKQKMKNQKRTFYRHRKLLVEAGVSWVMSNLNLRYVSVVPDDFSFLNEIYVDNSISEEVQKIMKEIA